jgi:uncharacterized repeat protein (TIGR01451 family)
MRSCGLICASVVLLAGLPEVIPAQNNPDLLVDLSKAGALPDVATGSNVAFVVKISNVSPVQAANVLTRVTIPAGFTALSPTPAPGSGLTCQLNGSVVECTAATFAGPASPSHLRSRG